MKLILPVTLTILNIFLTCCIVIVTYTNITISFRLEDLSNDIRDSWSKNQAVYERASVALGQVERDVIRIRNNLKKGPGP